MRPNSLPKKIIIKSKKELQEIQKAGCRRSGELLVLYQVNAAGETHPRFGFMAKGGTSKAFQRNRLKRIARELVRHNKDRFANLLTVISLKPSAIDKTFWQIKEDFDSLTAGLRKS